MKIEEVVEEDFGSNEVIQNIDDQGNYAKDIFKVVGIGGGGNNTIRQMVEMGILW